VASATPAITSTPPPPSANASVAPTAPPTVAPTSTPPASPATPPGADDVAARRAGQGPAGTEVAGAGEQAPTLPRTGTDVASTLVLALTAIACGQLARFAARYRRADHGATAA
jgi:hypothetical protein